MRFLTFGEKSNPAILMVHGYGVTWKMWQKQIDLLKEKYYVVLPLLKGMDLETGSEFVSVEDAADEIMTYVSVHLEGKLLLAIGASLGGTIVIELLAKNKLQIDFAIIDGGIAAPLNKTFLKWAVKVRKTQMKKMANGSKMAVNIFRKIATEEIVEEIVKLSKKITEKTIDNVHDSVYSYVFPESIRLTQTKVAYWHGSKEIFYVKKTIENLNNALPNLMVKSFKDYDHGELAMKSGDLYVREVLDLIGRA